MADIEGKPVTQKAIESQFFLSHNEPNDANTLVCVCVCMCAMLSERLGCYVFKILVFLFVFPVVWGPLFVNICVRQEAAGKSSQFCGRACVIKLLVN